MLLRSSRGRGKKAVIVMACESGLGGRATSNSPEQPGV